MTNHKTPRPSIVFEPGAAADILLAIALCPVEISGVAAISQINEQEYIVHDDVIIYPQECSLHGTEFDARAYAMWCHTYMEQDRGEEINRYRLWWHSHVCSLPYLSSTDESTIAKWGQGIRPWNVSVVGTKHNGAIMALDIFRPKRKRFAYRGMRLKNQLTPKEFLELIVSRQDKIQELLDTNVRIHPYAPFLNVLPMIRGISP